MSDTSPAPASGARRRLGILKAGRSPEEIIDRFPDYNQLFVDLLGANSFNYRTWAVLDNEFPQSIDDADAWLITGSRYGAYEEHDWIAPLEQLIRDLYAKGAPLAGICFGHQIIAQALGGKVEKFAKGWSVGRVQYQLDPAAWGDAHANGTHLMAFHQDQVTQLPEGARNVGSSDFCEHAALQYDTRILTIQPHPEFGHQFVQGLLQARADILPEPVYGHAMANLDGPVQSELIARRLRDFLNRDTDS